MKRIVEEGEGFKWHSFDCFICGCKFEYTIDEILPEGAVACPCCGTFLAIYEANNNNEEFNNETNSKR